MIKIVVIYLCFKKKFYVLTLFRIDYKVKYLDYFNPNKRYLLKIWLLKTSQIFLCFGGVLL